MLLDECSNGKDNNISLIKFIAAIFVIFNHSFPLTGSGGDYISRWAHGQTTFGGVAVSIFFFYGGFLIMKSMENKKNAKDYFKARCNRIFPELWMVILLSVFVLGPAVTELSLAEYFKSGSTYLYLLNGLLIPIHSLPGVFLHNEYNSTVNGALWTLPVEFICYILCFIFYKLKLSEKKYAIYTAPFVFGGYLVLWKFLKAIPLLHSALTPIMIFYAGMLFYIYREKIKIYWYVAIALLLILVIGIYFRLFFVVVLFTFPYFLAWFGFGTHIKTTKIGSKVKISYGMYLVGFPVQQLLCAVIPDISQMVNFVLATIIAVGFGVVLTIADKHLSLLFRKKCDEENFLNRVYIFRKLK